MVKAVDLQTLYGTVNNIDLWVGILAEDRLPNKSVGNTMHAKLKSQFEKLRDGDYYYYLHDPWLTANYRKQIVNTSGRCDTQKYFSHQFAKQCILY